MKYDVWLTLFVKDMNYAQRLKVVQEVPLEDALIAKKQVDEQVASQEYDRAKGDDNAKRIDIVVSDRFHLRLNSFEFLGHATTVEAP